MAALGVAEFTELVTSTFRNYQDQLFDNVMLKHPTLELLKDNIGSKSGRALVVDLELGLDNSTTITDDSGTFNPTVSSDIMSSAQYEWSNVIVSHTRVEYKRLRMNSGREKRHDLVRRHIANMMYSHGRQLSLALHNRKDLDEVVSGWFDSLDMLLGDATYDADPAGDASVPAFTIGGISSADQSLWVASRLEKPLDGSETIRKAFRSLANDIFVNTGGKNSVNAIICGQSVFEEYEDSFDDKVRYDSFGTGETRFPQLRFGDIPVRLDPDCPTRRAYLLDTQTFEFCSLDGAFMEQQEVKDVPNTLDKVTPAASILSIGVNERRGNGLLLRPSTAGGDA